MEPVAEGAQQTAAARAARSGGADGLAISVHGPVGVLDLVVPGGASVWDLAREYAELADLAAIPLIYTRAGEPLAPDAMLAASGLESGDVVVAAPTAYRPREAGARAGATAKPTATAAGGHPPGALSAAWVGVAAVAAALAGALVARGGGADPRDPVILILLGAVVVGVLPVGRHAGRRAVAAPAFAAAAAFALAWQPGPALLPVVAGAAGLAAAITAAVARSLDRTADEALKVWIAAGLALFVGGGAAAVLGLSAPSVWSILLLLAMLASRFVPMLAVDVPDHLLIDLQRLAVSAWSAREQPRGRRQRTVVPERAIQEVAERGARTVTAASVGIAVYAVLGSAVLLTADVHDLDRIGIRALVFLVGVSLLLVARSYRHATARSCLRLGGLACLTFLAVVLGTTAADGRLTLVAGISVALAAILVLAAVATGRGWRSVWWSRRAEIGESLFGAAAVASLFVSTGLFRALFDLTSRNAPS